MNLCKNNFNSQIKFKQDEQVYNQTYNQKKKVIQ